MRSSSYILQHLSFYWHEVQKVLRLFLLTSNNTWKNAQSKEQNMRGMKIYAIEHATITTSRISKKEKKCLRVYSYSFHRTHMSMYIMYTTERFIYYTYIQQNYTKK